MKQNQPPAFAGFQSPNYTIVPDEVFDELLGVLSGAELKVLLYIIRRTLGFKKERDSISLRQMVHGIVTRDGQLEAVYLPNFADTKHGSLSVSVQSALTGAMSDELVTQLSRDKLLQLLDLLVAKFDDAAALQVDQVIVMVARHFLIARTAIAEIVAGKDIGLFKQPHGTIDRGDADPRIDRGGAAVDLLDIGMVGGVRQHARDDAPLLGHL